MRGILVSNALTINTLNICYKSISVAICFKIKDRTCTINRVNQTITRHELHIRLVVVIEYNISSFGGENKIDYVATIGTVVYKSTIFYSRSTYRSICVNSEGL